MGAKLYFNQGPMNSSKTAQLLMAANNYKPNRVLIFKPVQDTRWGTGDSRVGRVTSRAGVEGQECILIGKDEKVSEVLMPMLEDGRVHCVFIDEVQFFSKEQVKDLTFIVDSLKIPVMAYGLKNTYIDGELFEGSAAMLYYADKITEIKTVCAFCGRKATMNLRVVNGEAVYEGATLQIGDVVEKDKEEPEEYYLQVCREHYKHPPKIVR